MSAKQQTRANTAPGAGTRPRSAQVDRSRAEAIERHAENVARLVCDLADLVYRHADTIAEWTHRRR